MKDAFTQIKQAESSNDLTRSLLDSFVFFKLRLSQSAKTDGNRFIVSRAMHPPRETAVTAK